MYQVKENVPSLGDSLEAGTLFPIQLPNVDKAYLATLQAEHPEMYEIMCRTQHEIKKITGVSRLSELDGRSTDKEFAEEVNERILLSRKALGENLPTEARAEKSKKYAKLVDKIKMDLVKRFAPGYSKALGTRNEVMATHNWGKLLLLAFDSSWNNKVRYEAKLKLVLADHFAKVDHKLHDRKDHLEFLADVMEERIFDPNGEKRGGTKTQWLVTKHDLANDNKCIGYEFVEEPPKSLAENELIEQIDFRTMEIQGADGTSQKINFMIDIGEKDEESIYLKSLRHPDRDLDNLLRDLNRGRLLFRNREEGNLVMMEMFSRLRAEHPKTGKAFAVEIQKRKDKVGGEAGKPSIQCDKFNLVIDGKDFEFQAFLPTDYRDYFCWKPASWCRHEVDRFFKNNLGETIWPEAHYPGLDRSRLAEEAFEREYEKEWASRRILPVRVPSKGSENEGVWPLESKEGQASGRIEV